MQHNYTLIVHSSYEKKIATTNHRQPVELQVGHEIYVQGHDHKQLLLKVERISVNTVTDEIFASCGMVIQLGMEHDYQCGYLPFGKMGMSLLKGAPKWPVRDAAQSHINLTPRKTLNPNEINKILGKESVECLLQTA